LENDVFTSDLLKKMYAPFGANVGRPDWPLWFHDYAFEATCYNTLRCSIIFARHQHALTPHLSSPSGQPHDPDWKKDWYAGFSTGEDFQRHGFPSPVDIRWTALDGVEREIALDLDTVFPERLILHNVPEEEVREDWKASRHLRRVQILLEVNDRTVNVYMRAWVITKHLQDPANPRSNSRRDLMLAWTRTWPEEGTGSGDH